MTMKSRGWLGGWVTGLVLAWLALGSGAWAAPSAVQFSQRPAMAEVTLSPSGRRVAWLEAEPDGGNRLAVMDLDPTGKVRVVKSFADGIIQSLHWVNDDRLVFEATQEATVVREGGAGTFAIDHDGGAERRLIAWRHSTDGSTDSAIVRKLLPYGWFLEATLDDGSADVLVRRRINNARGDFESLQLARLNTHTGALENLSQGFPPGTRRWFLDVRHEPRLLWAYDEGRSKVYWRAGDAAQWTLVADFDRFKEAGINPWFVDADGSILVTSRQGSDTEALFKFDPVSRRVAAEPLARLPGFDLDPRKVVDTRTGRLVGLHFRTEREASHWFDEGLQRLQAALDAALPAGRVNRLICGRCETSRFIGVISASDRQSGETFVFDRQKGALQRLGAARPWIEEATQGRRSFHRVATRDGLPMPVYVTHPAGTAADQPLPTVVLVHGGPWVRGSDLGWDAEAQFLASRGYRVLQPEFRGSEGYGYRLYRAGWKAWGREMQDDLADAVGWAVSQRLTDAGKVCVVGGSYGGYAALMAPISHPGTFRCAASFAGVTDLQLMYSITWSDFSENHLRYNMPVLIGDRVQDAARLAAASPLLRVAEIKVPVLLGHGALDRRVPVEHARQFASAARQAGVDIEMVDYFDEAHGFNHPANQADWWGRLERFLARSLAAPR